MNGAVRKTALIAAIVCATAVIGAGPAGGAPAVAALRAAFGGAGVVHAHGLRAGLLAALALGGRRTPLVLTWHGGDAPADGGRGG